MNSFYTEVYRGGHNELDSKSSVPQGTVGSNPTASAIKPLETLGFQGFFISRNAVKILSSIANAVNAVTEFAEMQLKLAISSFQSRNIRNSLKMQNAVKMQ